MKKHFLKFSKPCKRHMGKFSHLGQSLILSHRKEIKKSVCPTLTNDQQKFQTFIHS